MIKKILALRKEAIITGSFWVTVGNFSVSIGNYLFNLLMGRLLTPEDYGALASLISLSIIVSLPTAIVTTIITKFSAGFFAQKGYLKITRLAKKFTIYTIWGGMIILTSFVFGTPFLQNFLKINDPRLFVLIGILIGFGLVGSVNRGILQGLLYFKILSFLGVLTVLIKLGSGWYFVSRELKVFGALLAMVVSSFLPWIISFWPIKRFYLQDTKAKFGLRKKILSISLPTFAVTATASLFLSTDLILVKHYFGAEEAGIYAAASVMGKVIFYIIGPISQVSFPVVAQRFARDKTWIKDALFALLLVSVPGLIGVLVYFLFPGLVIKIFFPKVAYYQATAMIGLYSIFMFLFSLNSLLTSVYLAIEETKLTYLAFLSALLQIILIIFFHQSLSDIIWVSIISTGLLFIIYISYLGKLWWSQKTNNFHE